MVKETSLTPHEEGVLLTSKIFRQGPEGAHDTCQWALQNGCGSTTPQQPWDNAIKKIWHADTRTAKEERLLALMITMAKTKPDVMPGWNSVSLPISPINLAL